ncbi:exosome complex exonuclease Rrp41 [Candidatus Woesearchaeota archaeon]|nr:MAG: exosome complex exonuclease Rrp41 [Candidatus Woesearchaeota archaeon]
MAYEKRPDGRAFDELRPIEAEVGVVPRAVGSARFKIGKTEAIAAVYGPKEMHPRSLSDPKQGVLRCNYNMMPFSGSGDRVRPGQNRRAKEISMVTENALKPVVDLSMWPGAVVDVFIEFPQTDAGSRCAGICAAAMALADAGIVMRDLVAAVSVGRVDDKIVVDLDYAEEAYPDGPVADIPLAMVNNTGEVTLLQMDGEITKDQLMQALKLGEKALKEINKAQVAALKAKYERK